MNKVYLDMTGRKNCPGICVEDRELIRTGITVYSMSIDEKNEIYQQYADDYDIHFIFEDNTPKIYFYTVPQVDVFATDSQGGLIGTVGAITDLQSDSPICYIDKDKNSFLIVNSGAEFLERASNWKANLQPYSEIVFYESKLEAEKELKFINV